MVSTPNNLTPMLRQYADFKAERPDVLLFMRVGDFFEAYFDDAEIIAREIEITLTGRDDKQAGGRIPMCGVPHHALERYVARLIARGFKVAVCDQVEDPKLAKGLVKRAVTRVMTPGTVVEDSMLDARSNNYLVAAITGERMPSGVGVVDVSTGEFLVTEMPCDAQTSRVVEEVMRLQPAECLLRPGMHDLAEAIRSVSRAVVTFHEPTDHRSSARQCLLDHFGTSTLRGFGCEEMSTGLDAAALLLDYVRQTHQSSLAQIRSLATYSTESFMVLDAAARRNLELTHSLADGARNKSLVAILDRTVTSLGGRLLRKWFDQPLLAIDQIRARQDAVAEAAADTLLRSDLRDALRGVSDLERLTARICSGLANARDLLALKMSLLALPSVARALARAPEGGALEPLRRAVLPGVDNPRAPRAAGVAHVNGLPGVDDTCPPAGATPAAFSGRASAPIGVPLDLVDLLERSIAPDPPLLLREGGLIKDGFDADLDSLRDMRSGGKAFIARIEETERERTGIRNLKVGFNNVFGYYIEISKANGHVAVPDDYHRKQTTANAERYITPALKESESQVLGAEEKIVDLEYRLFCGVRDQIADRYAGRLQALARAVAHLDVYAGLAEVALQNGYARPDVHDGDTLSITAGRHPVVEQLQGGVRFVPNDTYLDTQNTRLHIITGPNSAGKSTYLRQVALIVLLAQVGSFVPADAASIGIVDRIFTRVGAHDDLASGQSTFMVEMSETANILNNATPRSLVILDEVGRGTSTFDGLALAWAVSEYLHAAGAKTLFATHYHHLNELEKRLEGAKNFRVAVKEHGDHIVWLRKIMPGGTDKSYGIQVARLAGVPDPVLRRASEVLKTLELASRGDNARSGMKRVPETKRVQLTLFEAERHPVIDELERLDLATLSPIEALTLLYDYQKRVNAG
ncbi:MAG: DNA mismatch repair protein MutS [Capsulimonadaceae bacterium]